MATKDENFALIDFLLSLTSEKDRGVLAELRRGLQYPPGEAVSMYRYIARYVPNEYRGREREKVYYLISALYAYHQENTTQGNFGNHMAALVDSEEKQAAVERRFTILLNANSADMHDYLRQSVSLLKSKEIPVNWNKLMSDLFHWSAPEKYIQRKWANSFWVYQNAETAN